MIDYEKLKIAHDIAKKCAVKSGIHSVSVDIQWHADEEMNFYINGSIMNNECEEYKNIDDLIERLKELTQPEQKFKVGQTVWLINGDNHPEPTTITNIDLAADEAYWLSEFSEWAREDILYESPEELIEAQVNHWLSMLEMPDQIRYFAKQAKLRTCIENKEMWEVFR